MITVAKKFTPLVQCSCMPLSQDIKFLKVTKSTVSSDRVKWRCPIPYTPCECYWRINRILQIPDIGTQSCVIVMIFIDNSTIMNINIHNFSLHTFQAMDTLLCKLACSYIFSFSHSRIYLLKSFS